MAKTTAEKVDDIHAAVIRMEPMVREHHRTLYGNGNPGLSKSVDRQEQRWKLVVTAFVPIYAVTIGLLIKWICGK